MSYDYRVLNYEVVVAERLYNDGRVMLEKTYPFGTEEEAVEYARQRYKDGYSVSVRQIRCIEDWVTQE